jgi:hypothetical protein
MYAIQRDRFSGLYGARPQDHALAGVGDTDEHLPMGDVVQVQSKLSAW